MKSEVAIASLFPLHPTPPKSTLSITSKLVDVYTTSSGKAFTARGQNQSQKRRCQGPRQARALQSVIRGSLLTRNANAHCVRFCAAVFRDQLYRHLETVPAGDFEGYTNKLVQAGSTLEFLKYADALFEILLAGGLLQPGGSYVDDGAPPSPFSTFNAKEPVEVADVKQYVDVMNKLTRRCVYALGYAFPLADVMT